MNRPSTRGARALLLVAALVGISHGVGAAERGPLRKPAPSATASVETEARVIVKFKADSSLMKALSAQPGAMKSPQQAQTLASRLGLVLTDGRVVGARTQVMKGRGLSSRDLADRLAAQADVEYAVVDGRVHALAAPNDPLYPAGQAAPMPAVGQWYLRAPTSSTIVDATSVLSSINAEAAWNLSNGSGVVVAVLDTGIRADHPDFAGKLLPGSDFVTDVATAVDGDARDADPSDPGDAGCDGSSDPSSWHGTQTAGLIGAATNNGVGMASVGRDVKVLPVRVLGKCGGFDSDIQAGMRWAAGVAGTGNPNPAKVINMSLGSTGSCSQAYKDAITDVTAMGAVVVVAAGNDGLAVGTPALCPGVIAVAGVRHAGTKVGYSDLGPQVAIAAPAGNCVNASGDCLFPLITTSNKGTTTPIVGAAGAVYTDGSADPSLGTSFSAPLVSGTVALMLSANPTLTPAQVLTHLQQSARPFPQTGAAAGVTACRAPTSVAQDSECYCTTTTCGAGLLDAAAAVDSVAVVRSAIQVASNTVVPGTPVTLDCSGSRAGPGGASGLTYQWAITSGADIATFTSAVNAASATLLPTAAGSVGVSLTVTDGAGHSATSTTTLTVSGPATGNPDTPPSSGGGGGGAMGFGLLLAGLVAVFGVRAVRPRRRV